MRERHPDVVAFGLTRLLQTPGRVPQVGVRRYSSTRPGLTPAPALPFR